MQQRVQRSHRRHQPSSAAQLPIAPALGAGSLTLLGSMIHYILPNVKPLLYGNREINFLLVYHIICKNEY